jgi:hypothetical protein
VGKRIALALEDDLYLAIHLMIAGRLHWRAPGANVPARLGLAAFDFPRGTLLLTEASSKKCAVELFSFHPLPLLELLNLRQEALELRRYKAEYFC